MIKEIDIKKVENALALLFVEAKYSRTEATNVWKLHRGEADIILFLRVSSFANGSEILTLVLNCEFMQLPVNVEQQKSVKDLAFEFSHLLAFEKFTIFEDSIFLSSVLDFSMYNYAELSKRIDNFTILASELLPKMRKNAV